MDMTNGEYVYVVAEQVPFPNVDTLWMVGDEHDQTARIAFQSVLQVRSISHKVLAKYCIICFGGLSESLTMPAITTACVE